jgi:transposase InsO family protein
VILKVLGEFKMPWIEETTMSLKEEFVKRALIKQESFSALCKEFKITRKTGYRILKRFEAEGLPGLLPLSKKPLTNPYKTDKKIEEKIVEIRLKEPTWGPRKILRYLRNKGMKQLPAPSTATNILKRYNLISIEESLKRYKLIRFERTQPNDLWQMDFKGKFQLLTRQSCFPLTIIDDHSRFAVDIKACTNEQYLLVKKRLTYIFEKYGLPNQINVDNGNPWGNSHLLSHTALTIWLMQLGVRVTHSRPRHPQTNGKCERFHRTLKEDLLNRYPMRTFLHAQKLFNQWRHQYNHERPHEALNFDCPIKRYQSSKKLMPSRLPVIEYGDNAIVRKVRGNGYISYNRKEYLVGEAFKGLNIEVKNDEISRAIILHFGQFQIFNYDYSDGR